MVEREPEDDGQPWEYEVFAVGGSDAKNEVSFLTFLQLYFLASGYDKRELFFAKKRRYLRILFLVLHSKCLRFLNHVTSPLLADPELQSERGDLELPPGHSGRKDDAAKCGKMADGRHFHGKNSCFVHYYVVCASPKRHIVNILAKGKKHSFLLLIIETSSPIIPTREITMNAAIFRICW